MRAALLLAGTCLLLTIAPAASALVGDTTIDVAGHVFTYTDPDPTYCKGDIGVGGYRDPVEVRTGSGGPGAGPCRNYVRVL